MDFEKLPRFKMHSMEIVCKVSEWESLFHVDREEIKRQIGLAHGWIDVNPKKAPKKNVMRYLYNWLCIAQRKGSLLQRPREVFKELEPESEVMTGDDFAKMREAIRGKNPVSKSA